jgi:DNA polymerase I-like protein with 3'-5' exonuclease and polymerase domains
MGYLKNMFGTIIRPQKSWAAYSNFISALAADMVVEKLYEIKDYIKEKKTKFLFQVHDSFVFDFHPEELCIIKELEELLSKFGEKIFQVKHSIGNNFYECNSEKESLEIMDTAISNPV